MREIPQAECAGRGYTGVEGEITEEAGAGGTVGGGVWDVTGEGGEKGEGGQEEEEWDGDIRRDEKSE